MFEDSKERLRTELAKLKQMSWSNRISHIWEYYKLTFIVIVVLIAATVSLVQAQIEAKKDMIISGAFINSATTEKGYDYLSDDYWGFKGSDKNRRIAITTCIQLTDKKGNFTSDSAQNVSKIDTFIVGQVHDYYILDQHALSFLDDREYLLDLSTVLSEDQMDVWKDRLVYNKQNICIAIDLTDSKFVKEFGLSCTSYFSGVCNGQNLEEIPAFLEYIIG